MPATELVFGPFRFDPSSKVLMRGQGIVPLTPKAAEVLHLLTQNVGRVVEKATILNAVWENTFVEEGSLAQNIFHLRRVLGESYIQTVPRKGYRFVTPGSDSPSIAVLPFVNLSGERDLEYFCDGLTAEIIGALSSVHGLRVAARSSSFQFKAQPIDIRQAGRTLNVSSVIEGVIRKSGDRLKVSVQLNSVSDGFCVWSETFLRSGDDLPALETEIATAILKSLQMNAVIPQRSPVKPQAYHLYLKGRFFWNKRPVEMDRAMEYFQQAIQADPSYALAYVGLADCYSTQAAWEFGRLAPRDGFPKARSFAERAIELDGRLGEAFATLGYARLHYDWDLAAAERDFQTSLKLNPGYAPAHHWYSHVLTAGGRTAESLEASNRALELDPLDAIINSHMAWHFYYAGDIDSMAASIQALRELHPTDHWTEFFAGWLSELQGRTGDAVCHFQQAEETSEHAPVMQTALARALAVDLETSDSRQLLQKLLDLAQTRYVSSYELALIQSALGDQQGAAKYVDRAIEERSAWIAYARHDPRLPGSLKVLLPRL